MTVRSCCEGEGGDEKMEDAREIITRDLFQPHLVIAATLPSAQKSSRSWQQWRQKIP
jgi:hypothetical protein